MNAIAAYASVQQADLNDKVAEYAPLVKRIAHHLAARLPKSVQADDLIQAGLIGLMEAAQHYDAGQGASFETYAGIRVRGAMLDEVRRNDWVPRSVHRKARAVAEAVNQVENAIGREARDHEIAQALGMSLADYHETLVEITGHRVLSFEDDGVEDEAAETLIDKAADPSHGLEDEDLRRNLTAAITGLPERERLVLSLYYDEELNLREIGEVLGVTESRVCQIHSQALVRLKARFGGHEEKRGRR